MKETIDQTIRRWLRKWLGIESDHRELEILHKQCGDGFTATADKFQELSEQLAAGMTEVENTRADLIQRMDDLAKELAQPKRYQSEDKPEEHTQIKSHVPFSVRRRAAQGKARNAQAYLAPKK